jgi:hypothetical protein
MSGSSMNRAFYAAANASRPRKHHPPPFSIRLTEEERARLRHEAGDLAMSAYIRQKLLGDAVTPRRAHQLRRRPAPSVDQALLGQALGTLGQSRIASNLNQIAKAANSGALPVSPELKDELNAACEAVRAMRAALMAAMGVRAQPSRGGAAAGGRDDAGGGA